GVLTVGKPVDSAFDADEVVLLERIGQQLAVAIENAIHFEQAERFQREASDQRDRLQLLLDVNNALVSQVDSHSFRLSTLEVVQSVVPHDYASLAIFDAERRELRLEAMPNYAV